MMWHIFIGGCKRFGLHQICIKFNLFIKISNFYIFLIVSLFFIHNNYHPLFSFSRDTKKKKKIVSVNLQDYGSNHIFLHKSMWPDVSKFWIFFFFFFWGTVNFRFNWLKCFYYYASTNTSATIIFLKCWHGKVYILCQKVFGQIGNVYLRIFLVAERNNHYNKKTTKI